MKDLEMNESSDSKNTDVIQNINNDELKIKKQIFGFSDRKISMFFIFDLVKAF